MSGGDTGQEGGIILIQKCPVGTPAREEKNVRWDTDQGRRTPARKKGTPTKEKGTLRNQP